MAAWKSAGENPGKVDVCLISLDRKKSAQNQLFGQLEDHTMTGE